MLGSERSPGPSTIEMELFVTPHARSFLVFCLFSGIFGYLAGPSLEPNRPSGMLAMTGLVVGMAIGVLLFSVSWIVSAKGPI